ncbi:IMPACT family protein [Bordetella genomosp. 13]|uniref:Thymidylate synthase n=1 Tax=Bordetella genomosp. 13 TaxID=463040 RepID=A0A1W6ZEW5_9BORD|nr:YigZ family protein [Bordetella genomosp. 13]ARP95414.1 thymidylate synthase [Bordetella genomosp. 13]
MTHTLAALCTHEEEIKKSRFLAFAGPAASIDEAMALIARHSDPAATHNCWAYRIGNEYRSNDDGEPGGTAGRPILQAIDGLCLDRVAVLVVRWYGGIKLGAGGLVRAYGGCAANCLRQGERVELIDTVAAWCRCDFADLPLLRARLAQAGAVVESENFDERGPELVLQVPRSQLSELEQVVANVTRGRGDWRIHDDRQ